MSAYSDPAYLQSLADYGKPLWLPGSGAGLLVQEILGTGWHDARGAYPLLSCRDWSVLHEELAELKAPELVSLVAVADPLSKPRLVDLERAFPDLWRPYKEHNVVRLKGEYRGPFVEGHRRNLRKAARKVQVDTMDAPLLWLPDWLRLYGDLGRRHGIQGIAKFSDAAFAAQMASPGMRAYRAVKMGQTLAMTLWIHDEDRAYYHLGASTEEGYRQGASFALFAQGLGDFAREGVEQVLLGAGAGVIGDPDCGLSRFKAGWANAKATAFLCGRVMNENAYRSLAQGVNTAYFPAYRCPRQSSAAYRAAA